MLWWNPLQVASWKQEKTAILFTLRESRGCRISPLMRDLRPALSRVRGKVLQLYPWHLRSAASSTFATLGFIFSSGVFAAPVSLQMAEDVARTHLRVNNKRKKLASLKKRKVFEKRSVSMLDIIELQNGVVLTLSGGWNSSYTSQASISYASSLTRSKGTFIVKRVGIQR